MFIISVIQNLKFYTLSSNSEFNFTAIFSSNIVIVNTSLTSRRSNICVFFKWYITICFFWTTVRMKVENGRSILTSKQKHQLNSIITLKIPMFPFFFLTFWTILGCLRLIQRKLKDPHTQTVKRSLNRKMTFTT